ncbi:hypothetical protein AB1E18_019479 [Capra hircus]
MLKPNATFTLGHALWQPSLITPSPGSLRGLMVEGQEGPLGSRCCPSAGATTDTNVVSREGQGPPDSQSCSPGEYWIAGRCCKACPAGQHVREPCKRSHSWGQCVPCPPGTFMNCLNGMEACFNCSACSKNLPLPPDPRLTDPPSSHPTTPMDPLPPPPRTCHLHRHPHPPPDQRCLSGPADEEVLEEGTRPSVSKGITLPITAEEKMPGQAGRLRVGKAVLRPQILRASPLCFLGAALGCSGTCFLGNP